MTIEELTALLETIPKTGVLNKATRKAIRDQIYVLMMEKEKES